MQSLVRLIFDEEAATSVEYAVVLALILMAIIGAITSMGDETAGMWENIDGRVTPLLSETPEAG